MFFFKKNSLGNITLAELFFGINHPTVQGLI
jgi:hypothetical protein